jgi:acetyl-CoA acetyltransferase
MKPGDRSWRCLDPGCGRGAQYRPGGKLPLNTNGGGLSYMHPEKYGMYALQESARQMRGTAPAQIPDAKISTMVCGMFAASGTMIMSNEAP